MAVLAKSKQLRKEVSLLGVYAIATGTTLSAGFFLLPGLAAAEAGPAVILSYMLAAIPLIPAMFCMMELATAMPRAGGTYYFLDRSMGPLVGTIGGLGVWLSLMLKTSFALIGMGAYLSLFVKGNYIVPLAIALAVAFAVVNMVGAKATGSFQTFLVGIILVILLWFVGGGVFKVETAHFNDFFGAGSKGIVSTAGLVYISYVGVTKVASVSEEVKNPERNLPLGMFLAFATAIIIYALGTYAMVGMVPPEVLHTSYTPVADAAERMAGKWGVIAVTIGAIAAFFSVTNAGILSASRYPLAMSRDHLLPRILSRLSKNGVPRFGILLTLGVIILILLALNPVKIAKLASSFQLLVFALCCLAVIIMRESQIASYDPGYRSPWYPWLPLFGIVTPFWLIAQMGWLSILFAAALVAAGAAWYWFYAKPKISRRGAVMHVFQRIGERRDAGLDPELRGILKEKGLRDSDPFDELIARARVLDLTGERPFEEITREAAQLLADMVPVAADKLAEEILNGSRIGATPVSHGVALPHLRLKDIETPEMVIVRTGGGVRMGPEDVEAWGEFAPEGPIDAIFYLVSPDSDPHLHLRILAQIATRVDDASFAHDWMAFRDEQELKELLLRDDYYLPLTLLNAGPAAALIGREVRQLDMLGDCLIMMIRREGKCIIPHGEHLLREGDRLTIIGTPAGIRELRDKYVAGPAGATG